MLTAFLVPIRWDEFSPLTSTYYERCLTIGSYHREGWVLFAVSIPYGMLIDLFSLLRYLLYFSYYCNKFMILSLMEKAGSYSQHRFYRRGALDLISLLRYLLYFSYYCNKFMILSLMEERSDAAISFSIARIFKNQDCGYNWMWLPLKLMVGNNALSQWQDVGCSECDCHKMINHFSQWQKEKPS